MPDPAMSALLIAVRDGANLSRMIAHLGKIEDAAQLEVLGAERPAAGSAPRAGAADPLSRSAHRRRRSLDQRTGPRRASAPPARLSSLSSRIMQSRSAATGCAVIWQRIAGRMPGSARKCGPPTPAARSAGSIFLVDYAPWMDIAEAQDRASLPATIPAASALRWPNSTISSRSYSTRNGFSTRDCAPAAIACASTLRSRSRI